ncbi:MAG: ABC transporter permease [Actinomycetota bacterium]|nr:ABC transporter permease [Actinomycetota bacterium]
MNTLAERMDAVGTEIRGPSALGSDPKRLLRLTWALGVTEFRLKFFGSALGYLWQLMRPLMLFGVLYGVFSVFLNISEKIRFYPVALLLGIVLYSFFNEATSSSVRSLVNRENLVRKVEFPRLAVPLSTVLTALFNLGLNLIPVAIFLLIAGGTPRLSWLQLPLLVGILALFALGLAMLLSVLFVRYRDIEPIWDVVLQVAFYATPIFYPVELLIDKGHPGLAKILECNPLAAVIQQARHGFIDPSHASISTALGSYALILVPLALVVLAVGVGFTVFDRQAPRVAEEL